MLVVGNPRAGAGFGSLPFAEREARMVQDLFEAGGADALIGNRATIPRWLALDPGRYRYLHFALHAQADDRDPERTALRFTDGSLRLSAIRQLKLRAELVSLSACETAVGRWVRGEGVIGLPYAFLAAGARGALVTFWRVPDQTAADFSEAFYREIRRGHHPAEALARVKAAWRSAGGDRSHPSRWAAFAFVGAPT
jgi:CHAT domain-containing protein